MKSSFSPPQHKTLEKTLDYYTLVLLLYIVLSISILIGQEPPAYFENSSDFVDKHDYSLIYYPIISAYYTAFKAHG